jgi:hypothetical protein
LERAAQYPWVDEGACAVREASNEWKILVERCYHALDLARKGGKISTAAQCDRACKDADYVRGICRE